MKADWSFQSYLLPKVGAETEQEEVTVTPDYSFGNTKHVGLGGREQLIWELPFSLIFLTSQAR